MSHYLIGHKIEVVVGRWCVVMMSENKRPDPRSEGSAQSEKHSIRHRLAGILICICLLAVSMPLEYYIWPAAPAQAEDEIVNIDMVSADDPDHMGEGLLTTEEELPNLDEEGESEKSPVSEEADGRDPEQSDRPEGIIDTQGENRPETGESQEIAEPVDPDKDQSDSQSSNQPDSQPSNQPESQEGGRTDASGDISEEPPQGAVADGGPEKAHEPQAGAAENTAAQPMVQPERQDAPSVQPEAQTENAGVGSRQAKSIDVIKFYSGDSLEPQEITVSESGDVNLPPLRTLEGDWNPLGWSAATHMDDLTVSSPGTAVGVNYTQYFGLYSKDVTVTFHWPDGSGGEAEETVKGTAYTKIVPTASAGRTTKNAEFYKTVPEIKDHTFIGWSKEPVKTDRVKADFQAGEPVKAKENLHVYAMYTKDVPITFYSGQKESAASQIRTGHINVDTGKGTVEAPVLADMAEIKDWEPLGWSTGTDPDSGITFDSGADIPITADTRACYGVYRQSVTLTYHPNRGQGEPVVAEGSRRAVAGDDGNMIIRDPEFALTARPVRDGYTLVGWYTQKEDGSADTAYDKDESYRFSGDTDLYARWEDWTAPQLGDAEYSPGYRGILDWIIHKKGLTVTIPVYELGSGVASAQYTLIPDKDSGGTAQTYTTEDPKAETRNIRVLTQNQQSVIQFTINEEFKGKVVVTCTDKSDNTSIEKVLTADGGIIVEDNPPQIKIQAPEKTNSNGTAVIEVTVEDALDHRISGGIAGVSYRVDEDEENVCPAEHFNGAIVEQYRFSIEISGEGLHKLHILAIDNAGNISPKELTVNLRKPSTEKPDGGNTGDGNGGTGNSGSGNEGTGNNGSGNEGTGNNGSGGSGNSGNGNEGTGNGNGGTGNNSGSGNEGTGNSGSGNEGSGNSGSENQGTGNTVTEGTGGSLGGGIVVADGNNSGNTADNSNTGTKKGTDITQTQTGEPKTGEFAHVEIYAAIAIAAGLIYLLLYFGTGSRAMTEKKKDAHIARLAGWAARGGFLRRILAGTAMFLLVAYYHSVGRCKKWIEGLREMTRV